MKNITQQSYEQILDACGNGITIINNVGDIVYANAITHDIFKYENTSLVGMSLSQLRFKHFDIQSSFETPIPKKMNADSTDAFSALNLNSVYESMTAEGNILYLKVTFQSIEYNEQPCTLLTIEKVNPYASNKSTELLSQVIELSENTFFLTDENNKIIWTNTSATKQTGYTKEILKGMNPLFRVTDNTSIAVLKRLKTAFRDKIDFNGEIQLYKANKEAYWVKLTVKPVSLDSGKTGFLLSEYDITPRKLIEHELRAKTNLQRAILDSAQQIIISTNANGAIESLNEFAIELLGWQPYELVHKSSMDVFIRRAEYRRFAQHIASQYEYHIMENFEAFHELTNKLDKVEFAFTFETKDRLLLTIELIVTPLFDRAGKLEGYLYIGKDITHVEKLKAQTQRSQALLEETSRIAQLGSWELDLRTNELYWSDETYRIHELPLSTDINVINGINYYAPEARPIIQDAVNKAIEFGTPWDLQLPFITAKNNHIWVRAIGAAEFKDSKVISIKGTLQNITAIKEIEERANEASQSKSDFLANMSHEIRTPINGIIGMNELLQKTSLTTQQTQYTQAIQRSSQALLGLINDILEFSKIEAGKLNLNVKKVAMDEFMENIYKEIQPFSDAKNLQLDIQVCPLVTIMSDPLRLRQILINLCSNAIKFTEYGSIRISFSVIDEQYLRFTISDTGIGIPSEKSSQLFERFNQLDTSSKRSIGGTGLGLTISQQLSQLLGGAIGFNPEYQEGAEFWFTVDTQLNEFYSQSSVFKTHQTVCIVDNDNELLRFTSHPINSQYDVRLFNSAQAFLAFFNEHHSSLSINSVFISHHLHGTTGIELLKLLRSQPVFKDLFVFLFNGELNTTELDNLSFVGLNGYLNDIHGPNILENILKKCASTHTSPDNLPFYTLQNLENTHARVLLVEDNDINQVVAKSILENLDLVVDIANNGQEALSLLMEKEDRYHAILMDCQMPVLDGYSATKLIRSMPEYDLHKYTPIIALTANAMEGDEEKCLTAGMNSFVTKPINTERLKEELEKWI
ncbi:MAG: PAS domain S-box protein [Glaciecola sp.]